MSRRRRARMIRIHVAMSRRMREELEAALTQDGRSLGEFIRTLIFYELRYGHKKIVPPSAAH